MNLSNLQPAEGSTHNQNKRVGRGDGGGVGSWLGKAVVRTGGATYMVGEDVGSGVGVTVGTNVGNGVGTGVG